MLEYASIEAELGRMDDFEETLMLVQRLALAAERARLAAEGDATDECSFLWKLAFSCDRLALDLVDALFPGRRAPKVGAPGGTLMVILPAQCQPAPAAM